MAKAVFWEQGERDGGREAGGQVPAEPMTVDSRLDSFCVAVELDAATDEATVRRVYDQVGAWLRDRVTEVVRDGHAPADAERAALIRELQRIEPRLQPEQLRRDLQADDISQLIRSAERFRGQDPWLLYPRARGVRALLFYDIPPGARQATNPAELEAQVDRIRELKDVVNLNLPPDGRATVRVSDAVGVDLQATIVGAHGNLLYSGSQSDGPTPGCLPDVALDGEWRFRFDQKLADLLARPAQPTVPVVVAILDTCPTVQQVTAAAAACWPDNWLLQRVNQEIHARRGFIIDRDEAHPLLDNAIHDRYDQQVKDAPIKLLPNMLDQQPATGADLEHYRATDHGLFVAGIVRSIAPFAHIRLIRALSDFGIGDMFAVGSILRGLPSLPEVKGKDVRLIVNLSLGVDIPPGDAYLAHEYPSLFKHVLDKVGEEGQAELEGGFYEGLVTLARKEPRLESLLRAVGEFLEHSHIGLQWAVSWLADAEGAASVPGTLGKRALIVAASGNDYDDLEGHPFRKEPRFPAGYENVLSVGALDENLRPSRFSNQGDEKSLRDGVATFGGNATRRVKGTLPTLQKDDVGIVSIIASERVLPPEKGTHPKPCASYWASWAGTSFAAPIISGVAAGLWANDPQCEPQPNLMTRIREFGPPGDPAPPLFAPTLPAWQHRMRNRTP